MNRWIYSLIALSVGACATAGAVLPAVDRVDMRWVALIVCFALVSAVTWAAWRLGRDEDNRVILRAAQSEQDAEACRAIDAAIHEYEKRGDVP